MSANDATITAANVKAPSEANKVLEATAGEALSEGDWVYRDSTDSEKAKKADANNSDATATVVGMAITPAATDDPVLIAKPGSTLIIGATTGHVMAKGDLFVLSDTAGKMALAGDQTTGWRIVPTAYAVSTTEIHILEQPDTLVTI